MNNTKPSFTVEIAKWRSGGTGSNKHGEGKTYLMNHEGYMCCLGFACEQLGHVSRDLMCNLPDPMALASETHRPIPCLTTDDRYHTALAHYAMEINDNTTLDLKTRMQKLTELFDRHGIEVKFV